MTDLRDRLAQTIGVQPEQRKALVRSMIERHARDRVGYWFQLALSTGIATLGLVLGSGGVVIGAMLISPLMGPLVEFGMGLAIGSPVLVVRSFLRTLGSVVACVAGSAAIAWLLPYQDVTAEIAARTSPTVLDLFVATFCALAAAFTTVRTTSDTAAAAAGTAIGISLVPPLCVGGYGIGTGLFDVSGGALLLFTANFSAIVLCAVLSFILLRFDEIDVHAVEQEVIDAGGSATQAGRWLHALFGAKYGRLLRILMPLMVAVAVFVPLRSALAEVSWEVRARKDIAALLQELPAAKRAIRSTVTVDRHTISIRLVVVGRREDGEQLQLDLKKRVAELAGVAPAVDVIAVPDADAVSKVAAPLLAKQFEAPAVAPLSLLPEVHAEIAETLREVWPGGSAGPLLGWKLDLPAGAAPVIELAHLGEPLGEVGEKLLATTLTAKLAASVTVRDVAHSAVASVAERGDVASWLPVLVRALEAVNHTEGLHACVQIAEAPKEDGGKPAPKAKLPKAKNAEPALDPVDAVVRDLLSRGAEGRVRADVGASWSVRLSAELCPEPPRAVIVDIDPAGVGTKQ